MSWNKLWGYSRCGFSHHHKDSDRFVWRRAQDCIDYSTVVEGEIENCPQAGMVEIAAYTYDDGLKPYEN